MAERTETAKALKALRDKAGLSIRQVAEGLKFSHTTYANYEGKIKKRYLPGDLATALVPILTSTGKVRPEEIWALTEAAAIHAGMGEPNAAFARDDRVSFKPGARDVPLVGPAYSGMPPRDALPDQIPVYYSAQGGDHGMLVSFDEVERIPRPEPLVGVVRAWAMNVVGDSMSPAYEHGDTALIHGSRAPGRGADVVLLKDQHGQSDAMLKRLMSWTKDKWKVRQFNPDKTFELSRKEWQHIYLIVGSYKALR